MIKDKADKLVFEMRLDFIVIHTTFRNIRRLYSYYDFMGSPGNIVRALFVSDLFRERLEQSVKKISFTLDESEIAQMMLRRRVFEKAVVVFKEDFPNAQIWKTFHDFLCVEFVTYNGPLLPGDKRYVEMPGMKGYASKGFGYTYLTIYDCEDDLIKKMMQNPDEFYVEHDEDEDVFGRGASSINFRLRDFVTHTDKRNRIHVPVTFGKEFRCGRCGKSLYFDNISPEQLLDVYRNHVLATI